MKVLYKISLVLCLVSPGMANSPADTIIAKKLNWMFYPYVFYTPESNLAFGAGGMLYFRADTSRRVQTSKIKLAGYYTLNNQYSFSIVPTIFFPGMKRIYLEADFRYQKLISKFYGIGSETPDIENAFYSLNKMRAYAEFSGRGMLLPSINTGIVLEFAVNDVYDSEANPNMQDSTLTGREGGNILGVGLLVLVDKRDNASFPTRNGYYKVLLTFYNKFLGSHFNYNNFLVDIRHFVSFGNEHILAMNLYTNITTGTPPFFSLPSLGGENHMRGYFEGRFRDRIFMTGQIEYRKIVWWRLGLMTFFGVGDVANKWKDFSARTLKFSYGFGLRFVFDEENRINLRMDIGFGRNTSGIYFGLDEAF